MLIESLAELEAFGSLLAAALPSCPAPLFLFGDLGCGKTALTARICKYWPGAAEAEVSSPSFTLCNVYPGRPPILHCDLYRAKSLPDEILEMADDTGGQLIVEWAEYMPRNMRDHLDICFNVVNDSRRLELRAFGERARAAREAVASGWRRLKTKTGGSVTV